MQEPPFFASDKLFTFADYQSPVWTWFADGTPVNFAGCTAALGFRVAPDDPAPLFQASVITLGIGAVSFTIARAELAGVTATVVHGDLLITMSDGTIVEFAHIDLEILAGSTY